MVFNYNDRRSRSRIRKRRKGTYPTGSYKYSLGVRHSPSYPNNNKGYWDRIEGPT
jgi:hypothetical protein